MMMTTLTTGPRLLASLLLAFAVAAGFFGGILADRFLLAPRESVASPAPAATTDARRAQRHAPHGAPRSAEDPARYLDFIDRQLNLSAEQRGEIEAILAAQQQRVDSILRESRPRMREVAHETRDRIQQVLTTEQRERFDEMRRQRMQRSPAQSPSTDSP
jgi:hypothetical protein